SGAGHRRAPDPGGAGGAGPAGTGPDGTGDGGRAALGEAGRGAAGRGVPGRRREPDPAGGDPAAPGAGRAATGHRAARAGGRGGQPLRHLDSRYAAGQHGAVLGRTRVAATGAQPAADERDAAASGVGTPGGGEPDLRAAGAAGVTATTPSRAGHSAGGGPGAAADADRAAPGRSTARRRGMGAVDGHGGQLALEALRAFGVTELFTLSGGHVFPLYDAAHQAGVRIVDVRHEQSAVFAAEAVAKLQRRPGLA